jgi:hypothetical protein
MFNGIANTFTKIFSQITKETSEEKTKVPFEKKHLIATCIDKQVKIDIEEKILEKKKKELKDLQNGVNEKIEGILNPQKNNKQIEEEEEELNKVKVYTNILEEE